MFWFPYQISEKVRSGSYNLFASSSKTSDLGYIATYKLPCFQVLNEHLPALPSQPYHEYETFFPCSDDTPSRLQIGDRAFVSYIPADRTPSGKNRVEIKRNSDSSNPQKRSKSLKAPSVQMAGCGGRFVL